jgi:hypothetical protein
LAACATYEKFIEYEQLLEVSSANLLLNYSTSIFDFCEASVETQQPLLVLLSSEMMVIFSSGISSSKTSFSNYYSSKFKRFLRFKLSCCLNYFSGASSCARLILTLVSLSSNYYIFNPAYLIAGNSCLILNLSHVSGISAADAHGKISN